MRSKVNKASCIRIRTILLYNINLLHNNQIMASKESSGSILDSFFSKSKVQLSFSTQEIPLVDFSNRLVSSQDENTEISFATKISTVVETSNLSNLNNVLENNLEIENLQEMFGGSHVLLNTDNPTVVVAIDEISRIMLIGSKSTYFKMRCVML